MRDCDKPEDLALFHRISEEIHKEASFEKLKQRVGCINNCKIVTFTILHVRER